ncbi:MAG: thioredoxin family protein [Gammaproteobacteria bacterium]|nr:thioredoxin family protein [Gammaproteobacteria bacterium]
MPAIPQAQLFIAPGCPHCPAVLQALTELLKEGDISSLQAINIQLLPEKAEQLNIRSVPWLKLGPFELSGLRSKQELKQWITKLHEPSIMADYFAELITNGELDKVHQSLEDNPEYFPQLLHLIVDQETTLSVRIGVGAVIEDFTGSQLLEQQINQLAQYTLDDDARIRNDACYYLGLSHSPLAEPHIRPLLDDVNTDVIDTARDALDDIQQQQLK